MLPMAPILLRASNASENESELLCAAYPKSPHRAIYRVRRYHGSDALRSDLISRCSEHLVQASHQLVFAIHQQFVETALTVCVSALPHHTTAIAGTEESPTIHRMICLHVANYSPFVTSFDATTLWSNV